MFSRHQASPGCDGDPDRICHRHVVGGGDGPGRDAPTQVVRAGIQDNRGLAEALRRPRDKDQLLMPLADWVREQQRLGNRVRVVCPSRSLAERLDSLLHPYGLGTARAEGFPLAETDSKRAVICLGRISSGFVWPAEKLAVVADTSFPLTPAWLRRPWPRLTERVSTARRVISVKMLVPNWTRRRFMGALLGFLMGAKVCQREGRRERWGAG